MPTTWLDVLIQLLITGGVIAAAYFGNKVYREKKSRPDSPIPAPTTAADASTTNLVTQLREQDQSNPLVMLLEQFNARNLRLEEENRVANRQHASDAEEIGRLRGETSSLRGQVSRLEETVRRLEREIRDFRSQPTT